MPTTTTTYTTPGTYTFGGATGSNNTLSISCWGAGGNGGLNGVGGSGGAFASSSISVPSGSYTIVVGSANTDGYGNGGTSYFVSASIYRVRAAGGRSDGTTAYQASLNTGSIKYVGGAGGSYSAGVGNYNGSGGGSAAGLSGAGAAGGSGEDAGASFPQYGHAVTGSVGAPNVSGGGAGGNGAYYDSSTASRLINASAGTAPGGGGGGGYAGETSTPIATEGAGGAGKVQVVLYY